MKITGRPLRTLAGLIIAAGLLAGCSSVTVQTGPRSQEDMKSSSREQAGNIRATWADRFEKSNPVQTAAYLRVFIDSTAVRYLDFGDEVTRRWRDENHRQQRDVPATSIKEMVDRSIGTQVPIFDAYDDVVTLGMRSIEDSAYFDMKVQTLIKGMHNIYFEVRRLVFNPEGDISRYRAGIEDRRRDLQDLSRKVDEALQKYRR